MMVYDLSFLPHLGMIISVGKTSAGLQCLAVLITEDEALCRLSIAD